MPTVFEPAESSVFPNITDCNEILTVSNRPEGNKLPTKQNKTIPTDMPGR